MAAESFNPAVLRGGLIVSCQAEGEDPFNAPAMMGKFARAAALGGAAGIRAREAENIAAVRQAVDLPVIGITKAEYPDGSVLITPDSEAVEAVIESGAMIVALDVTRRTRPNGLTGPEFLAATRERYEVPLMADVSTLEEGIAAAEAGADFVGPTLAGYTPYTPRAPGGEPDWALLRNLVLWAGVPIIMEGGIWTPAQARKALDLGAFAVVVGTAITRPRVITAAFVTAIGKSPE